MKHDFIDDVQAEWSEQRPDLDAEPMGIVLRIQALAKILAQQAAESLEAFDLQWWQYDVLSALRRQGAPYTMAATELADAVDLTSGAMTNRIDGLESEGWVERLPDPNDRRRVLVCLTPKGLELVEAATGARFDAALSALDGLGMEQRRELSALLRAVLLEQ